MTDSQRDFAKRIASRTVADFAANRTTEMAAALSYYTIFSLAPLLVVIISVAGFALRKSGLASGRDVREETVLQIQNIVGQGAAEQIAGMVSAVSPQDGGWTAMLINIAAVLFGATVIMIQLQSSLNQAWQVQPKGGGVKGFIKKRLLSLGLVIGIALLMLVVMVLTTAIDVMQNRFLHVLPEGLRQWIDRGWLSHLTYLVVQTSLVAVLVGMLFKVLPDCVVQWSDVAVGALVTAVAFVIGRYAISLYLSAIDVTSGFGAAGSLAVILVWIYYSSLIFFLGAEFTHAYILERGGKLTPEPGAEHVVIESKVSPLDSDPKASDPSS